MDDVAGMKVINSEDDLEDEFLDARDAESQALLVFEVILEISSIAVLEENAELGFVYEVLLESVDVGVSKVLDHLALSQLIRDIVRVASVQLNDLHHLMFAIDHVSHFEHRAERALSQLFLDFEVLERASVHLAICSVYNNFHLDIIYILKEYKIILQ